MHSTDLTAAIAVKSFFENAASLYPAIEPQFMPGRGYTNQHRQYFSSPPVLSNLLTFHHDARIVSVQIEGFENQIPHRISHQIRLGERQYAHIECSCRQQRCRVKESLIATILNSSMPEIHSALHLNRISASYARILQACASLNQTPAASKHADRPVSAQIRVNTVAPHNHKLTNPQHQPLAGHKDRVLLAVNFMLTLPPATPRARKTRYLPFQDALDSDLARLESDNPEHFRSLMTLWAQHPRNVPLIISRDAQLSLLKHCMEKYEAVCTENFQQETVGGPFSIGTPVECGIRYEASPAGGTGSFMDVSFFNEERTFHSPYFAALNNLYVAHWDDGPDSADGALTLHQIQGDALLPLLLGDGVNLSADDLKALAADRATNKELHLLPQPPISKDVEAITDPLQATLFLAPVPAAGRRPKVRPMTLTARFAYGDRAVPTDQIGAPSSLIVSGDASFTVQREASKERLMLDGFKAAFPHAVDRDDEFAVDTASKENKAPLTNLDLQPILQSMQDLARLGFRLDIDPSLATLAPEQTNDIEVDAEDLDPKWFNVTLGMDINGERFPLLPIVMQLLSNNSFQLEKPADEPEDHTTLLQAKPSLFVPIRTERLRTALTPLIEWVSKGTLDEQGRIRVRKLSAAIANSRGELPWRNPEQLEDLRTLLTPPKELVQVPDFLVIPPEIEVKTYQLQAATWLSFLARCQLGGILADETGMGKTLTFLIHCAVEHAAGRLNGDILVTCLPNGVVKFFRAICAHLPMFQAEYLSNAAIPIQPRNPESGIRFVVATHTVAANRHRELSDTNTIRWSLMAADDAGLLKNPNNVISSRLRSIPATRRMSIWADPHENSFDEVYAHLDFVEPGVIGTPTDFRRNIRNPLLNGDPDALRRLRAITDVLILKRTHKQVGNPIPDNVHETTPVILSPEERDIYEMLRIAQNTVVRDAIEKKGLQKAKIDFLAAVMRLRRFCDHPKLTKLESCRHLESSKLREFQKLVSELRAEGGNSILVFSQWTDMLDLVSERLAQMDVPHDRIDGTMSPTRRQIVADRVQSGEIDLTLVSLGAGYASLDLFEANVVILLDRWWNPKRERQAIARMRRLGQKRTMRTFFLMAQDTIEESVVANQDEKLSQDAALFDQSSGLARESITAETISDFLGAATDIMPLDKARSINEQLASGDPTDETADPA